MSIAVLHQIVRAQMRGDNAQQNAIDSRPLAASERAAMQAMRRRIRRARGRSLVPPAGTVVWV